MSFNFNVEELTTISFQFGQVEVIAAGIIDEYPEYLRPRRKVFTLILCCVMFMMGIPLVTQVSTQTQLIHLLHVCPCWVLNGVSVSGPEGQSRGEGFKS